jgi:hypothetical protein
MAQVFTGRKSCSGNAIPKGIQNTQLTCSLAELSQPYKRDLVFTADRDQHEAGLHREVGRGVIDRVNLFDLIEPI